jgi:hypothetical protein
MNMNTNKLDLDIYIYIYNSLYWERERERDESQWCLELYVDEPLWITADEHDGLVIPIILSSRTAA